MAILKIYGTTRSRANRVIWMAEELGLPYETISVDLSAPRDPEFLKVNPNGRLPAIDDDGFHLFESMAINLYLAKKHGGPLAPRDMHEDAEDHSMVVLGRHRIGAAGPRLSHAYDVSAAGEARCKHCRESARDAEEADRGFGSGAGKIGPPRWRALYRRRSQCRGLCRLSRLSARIFDAISARREICRRHRFAARLQKSDAGPWIAIAPELRGRASTRKRSRISRSSPRSGGIIPARCARCMRPIRCVFLISATGSAGTTHSKARAFSISVAAAAFYASRWRAWALT